MADMKSPLLGSLSVGVLLCLGVAVSRAEEPSVQSPAPQAKSAPLDAEGARVEGAAPKPVEKSCPPGVVVDPPKKPAPSPVYVSDWGRLAALTESDLAVFERANSLASREDQVWRLLLPTGLLVGGGLAFAGTVGRLNDDHWTDATKWVKFSGVGVAAVTLLISWALSPGRDDFLTIINHWNLRHPDRPLAP